MNSRRIALVTGGSRGIGAAIARRLGQSGYWVGINYSSQSARAEEVLQSIRGAGGDGGLVPFDVSVSSQVDTAVKALQDAHGPIHCLVNNAGITLDGLLVRVKDEDMRRQLAVNLEGAILCTRSVLKGMMRARSGSIIQISSVIGEMGNAGQTVYAAAKSGLLGFTKALAKEVGSRSIRVNAVTPGFIETDMTTHLTPEIRETYLRQIPLGHFGTPEDVANLVAFLASDESQYITGQVISACGGLNI